MTMATKAAARGGSLFLRDAVTEKGAKRVQRGLTARQRSKIDRLIGEIARLIRPDAGTKKRRRPADGARRAA